jgi:hypothetical protein
MSLWQIPKEKIEYFSLLTFSWKSVFNKTIHDCRFADQFRTHQEKLNSIIITTRIINRGRGIFVLWSLTTHFKDNIIDWLPPQNPKWI